MDNFVPRDSIGKTINNDVEDTLDTVVREDLRDSNENKSTGLQNAHTSTCPKTPKSESSDTSCTRKRQRKQIPLPSIAEEKAQNLHEVQQPRERSIAGGDTCLVQAEVIRECAANHNMRAAPVQQPYNPLLSEVAIHVPKKAYLPAKLEMDDSKTHGSDSLTVEAPVCINLKDSTRLLDSGERQERSSSELQREVRHEDSGRSIDGYACDRTGIEERVIQQQDNLRVKGDQHNVE